MFNLPWEVPCWGILGNHSSHVSVAGVKPLQLHQLHLQNGISLSVSSRYSEHYKNPMEQMREHCENYPPCDYLSDQIGFFMAYNHFFRRYWTWDGHLVHFAWDHSEPPKRKKVVGGKEGRKPSRLGPPSVVSLASWNTKAIIIPLTELALAFFLSSKMFLFSHLLWYFEFH